MVIQHRLSITHIYWDGLPKFTSRVVSLRIINFVIIHTLLWCSFWKTKVSEINPGWSSDRHLQLQLQHKISRGGRDSSDIEFVRTSFPVHLLNSMKTFTFEPGFAWPPKVKPIWKKLISQSWLVQSHHFCKKKKSGKVRSNKTTISRFIDPFQNQKPEVSFIFYLKINVCVHISKIWT